MLKREYIKKYFLVLFLYFIVWGSAAQKLFSKQELDTCHIFSTFEEALKKPEIVYVLDLSGSSLDKIPADIIKLKNLQRLNLENNQITELPAGIFQLKNLQELNLEENKLQSLPNLIENLKNLKKLNLTRTKIPSLPKGFGKLKYLEHLNLSWNDLSSSGISPIFKLKNLSELNLQRNLIDSLSTGIGNLTKLRSLNLNFNPLHTLPEEIGKLTSLKEMDLGKNSDLTSLPMGFKKLINLEYLNLSGLTLTEDELKKIPAINPDNIEY
jgi:Leucine-rich repeat (LRR) protein